MPRLAWTIAIGFVLFSPPRVSVADVVPPMLDKCAPGWTARTEHGGHYCAPPLPKNCPPGHIPRVRRTQQWCDPPPPSSCPRGYVLRGEGDNRYCEPPPPEPCPRGSYWQWHPDGFQGCSVGERCDEQPCGRDAVCVKADLCLERAGRRETRVVGNCRACSKNGDHEWCLHAKVCEPKDKRKPVRDPGPPPPEPQLAPQ